MNTPILFWLHVPIETTRGDWFQLPPNGCLNVLGKRARLLERNLPNSVSLTSASTGVIKQWLIFDPVNEVEAHQLWKELTEKFPALAFEEKASFRIGQGELNIATHSKYDGRIPTLIPSSFTPDPEWGVPNITSYMDGTLVLGTKLNSISPVTDIRLVAALDLEVASRYDVLPRSIFLAQLTILDSLAVKSEREDATKQWIDEKIQEANKLNDPGLISSLTNLKQGSHGAAVRALVSRAVRAIGGDPTEQSAKSKLAGQLYNVRSALSHAGSGPTLNVRGARELVSIVLKASILDIDVLDPIAFAAKQCDGNKP